MQSSPYLLLFLLGRLTGQVIVHFLVHAQHLLIGAFSGLKDIHQSVDFGNHHLGVQFHAVVSVRLVGVPNGLDQFGGFPDVFQIPLQSMQ